MPQGANTDAPTTNGTQPNQNIGKLFTKLRNPTLFQKKIPNFENLKLKSTKLKENESNV